MAELSAESARRKAAEEQLKNAMTELFGEEKKIIVENRQPGVVSIGFGKNGNEGGYSIPRSKLPICLTAVFPAEFWLDSPDFRQALAKGWLRLVSNDEYERALEAEEAHQARLEALASGDAPTRQAVQKFDAEINPLQQSAIDPRTASLRPATSDEIADPELAERVRSYEKNLATPPPTPVIQDGRSVRAEALVEKTVRGSIQPLEAVKELDADANLYTLTDLEYIAKNAEFPGLRSFAQKLAHERRTA